MLVKSERQKSVTYGMVKEHDITKDEISFTEKNAKNKYGQYFTPNIVAEFMIDLANITLTSKILEPSCGEGIFLDILQNRGYSHMSAYEIDEELGKEFDCIQYESFVSAKISEKFDLIIGNPPYIQWKNLEPELKEELATNKLWSKYFNSLCDYLYIFILKSIELLKENGQLIFICPEYWMNTTHSISLRNYMVEHGYFERIYHFNETPIFNNATISVVIFKYVKSKNKNSTIDVVKYYKNRALSNELLSQIKDEDSVNPDIKKFSVPQFQKNKRWLLSDLNEIEKIEKLEESCSTKIEVKQDLFSKNISSSYPTIGDICDIGNGMVSGLDKAFQLNEQKLNNKEKAKTIKVIKAKHLKPFLYSDITKYIFANDVELESKFEKDYPNFHQKLIGQRGKLEKRYQYNKKIHYWQWVFLRNFNLFNKNCPRIFIPCKERISNKDYFRFAYVPSGIFPTQDVTAIFPKTETKENIHYILAFLNNHRVFTWLKNKGIVKGNIVEFSEKPISSIPFRKIDWSNENDVLLHNQISDYTKQYVDQREDLILEKINNLMDKLLNYK